MKKDISKNTISRYLIIHLFIFTTQSILAQTPINVIQSNQLEQIVINDTIFQKFSGNVILEYSDLKIQCDTILIDEYKILMQGWGNTNISNDTINCTTDSVNILQLANKIIFYQNTILETDSMIIYSDELEYDYKEKILEYFNGGNIKLNQKNIASQKFQHNLHTSISKFNTEVYLKSPDYNIETESMIKNEDLINFSGTTSINNNEYDIDCNQGFLQESTVLELSEGLLVKLENKTIQSENLKRDLKNKKNHFTNNVHVTIDNDTHILGESLIQVDSISTITENCELQLLTEGDSIVITGDIIEINERNDNMNIKDNVIIAGEDLDGNCAKMEFISNDNIINMLINPVLWFTDTQITGDTIMLFREKNQLDSIYIPSKPFIISPNDSLDYYNQIKGKFLEGKFKESKIEYVKVNRNGKMKYFDNNKDNGIIGVNNIEAGNIKLFFNKKNNVKSVLCSEQIESNYIEIDDRQNSQIKTAVLLLDGFNLINREKE